MPSPIHQPVLNNSIIKNCKIQLENIPIRTKFIPPPGFQRKSWILWEGIRNAPEPIRVIPVEKRVETGEQACKQFRKENWVPGLIEAWHVKDNVLIKVQSKIIDQLIRSGQGFLGRKKYILDLEGEMIKVKAQEIRRSLLNDQIRHVKFELSPTPDERIVLLEEKKEKEKRRKYPLPYRKRKPERSPAYKRRLRKLFRVQQGINRKINWVAKRKRDKTKQWISSPDLLPDIL